MKVLFVAKDPMLAFSVKEVVKKRMPSKDNEFEYCDLWEWRPILIGFNPDIVVLCYYYNEPLSKELVQEFERIKEDSNFIENTFSRYIFFKDHRLHISEQETDQVLYKLRLKTRAA